MSATIRIRIQPVMLHPSGVMIYKAMLRRRVICLLRRDGDGWLAYAEEGCVTGRTNYEAARNYYRTYLGGTI